MKIINEDTPQAQTLDLKDAFVFGCFSKENFPWLTIDEGVQPKDIKMDFKGATYDFKTGDKVVTGKNSKGQRVFFAAPESGKTGGKYYGIESGKVFDWDCPEALKLKGDKDEFINKFVEYNQNYTGETPSAFLIGREWEPVDVSTLDNSGLFKPGERTIYKKIGLINTNIDQYPWIEKIITKGGWTLKEPPIGTPQYDKRMDVVSLLGNSKYRNFFEDLRKKGITIYAYPSVEKTKTDGESGTTSKEEAINTDMKVFLDKAKNNKLDKKECKNAIKGLYLVNRTNNTGPNAFNADELLVARSKVFACQQQNIKFRWGNFGVGDELNQLVTDGGPYGIGSMVRGLRESVELKKIIKENLIKKSIQKENKLLSENTIIVSRYQLLNEGNKPKNKKELNKLFDLIITETAYLHSQGYDKELIKEGFLDLLQGIFGKASTSIFQYFQENVGKWLLNKLGVDTDSWLGNVLVTAIGNVNVTELPNLTNCSYVSNLLSKSMAEGAVNKIKNEQGLTGPAYDILRNALVEMGEDTSFGKKIEQKVSEFICPKLEGLKGKLEGVTGKMKSNALGLDGAKSLGTKVVDKVKDLGSKVVEPRGKLIQQ